MSEGKTENGGKSKVWVLPIDIKVVLQAQEGVSCIPRNAGPTKVGRTKQGSKRSERHGGRLRSSSVMGG